jgi:hypothetical protein
MATSLEYTRDELERQNAELESQQVELETTLSDLADQKTRVERLETFGSQLAAETELEAVAGTILTQLAEVAGAELGALYVFSEEAGEAALMSVHLAGYVTLVLVAMSPLQAAMFVVIHQGLFGLYLGCSFAPNHKGMPALSPAQNADYLLRQVLTSRNVHGHWLTDFALGGLNYQIEHHLFPSMPRCNLPAAQRIVRAFCAARDVSYLDTGLIASYAQALRHLDRVGRSQPGAAMN